jgi:integrase
MSTPTPVHHRPASTGDATVRESWPALYKATCEVIAARALDMATAQKYLHWVRRYARFYAARPIRDLTPERARTFLEVVAADPDHTDALCAEARAAVTFLHEEVFRQPMVPERAGLLEEVTPEEQEAVLQQLDQANRLLARLVFEAGLTLEEVVALRVGDLDFEASVIVTREHDGTPRRQQPMPRALRLPLRRQLSVAQRVHQADKADGFGVAFVPRALRRAGADARSWAWQFVFPAPGRTTDPSSGSAWRSAMAPTTVLQALVRVKGEQLAWPQPATTVEVRASAAASKTQEAASSDASASLFNFPSS